MTWGTPGACQRAVNRGFYLVLKPARFPRHRHCASSFFLPLTREVDFAAGKRRRERKARCRRAHRIAAFTLRKKQLCPPDIGFAITSRARCGLPHGKSRLSLSTKNSRVLSTWVFRVVIQLSVGYIYPAKKRRRFFNGGTSCSGASFFCAPVIFLILFLVRLCRYIAAKRKNKAVPGSVPEETVLTHRTLMIVFLIFTIVFSAIVLGVMALLSREIAYM